MRIKICEIVLPDKQVEVLAVLALNLALFNCLALEVRVFLFLEAVGNGCRGPSSSK